MEENFATRLKLFIENEGLNSSQFADLCEVPRPSLSQILSGRNKKISDKLVGSIHKAFPKLSILWLMFGEGEMYGNLGNANSNLYQESENPNPPDFSTDEIISNGENSEFANSSGQNEPQSQIFGSASQPDGQNGQNDGKFRFENCINPSNHANQDFHSNLKGLTTPPNQRQQRANQQVETDYKIMNLQRQIDEMRQNPRRVTQITIYYDDSTFETFVPKG